MTNYPSHIQEIIDTLVCSPEIKNSDNSFLKGKLLTRCLGDYNDSGELESVVIRSLGLSSDSECFRGEVIQSNSVDLPVGYISEFGKGFYFPF